MIKPQAGEKRIGMRWSHAFPVIVVSEAFGELPAIARNISKGGMGLEMAEPLPLGSVVTVHFVLPEGAAEISVSAEVKHHYCFNFHRGTEPASSRGIGLRFLEFLEDSEELLHHSFTRKRSIH